MIPKAPRPTISDIGVQVGIWKKSSAMVTSETSITNGKKRKADDTTNQSSKRMKKQTSESSRAQSTDPDHRAILTVSVTAKSVLTFGWRTETGNMNGGIDRVELVEFGTFSEARFAAIEAHDRLARKRVKSFAATRSREDEAYPFVDFNLLPTKVLKPLLAVDEQERQLKEILQHKEWKEKKLRFPDIGDKAETAYPEMAHTFPFVRVLHARIAERKDLAPLRQFVAGTITWTDSTVEGFLESLVRHADFLCVTPAASQYHKLYRDWKATDARGVAIDETASYGEISAMSALLAFSFTVSRFNSVRPEECLTLTPRCYPDVPFTYHGSRAINNPEFKVERGIDGWFHGSFPELSAAVLSLKHGSGSQDPKAGSKRSHHQIKVGLDLLNGSVHDLHINPKEVAVIAPYAAKTLPDAATIESFQGQESAIALVVIGTAHPRPGPGFAQNKQRLNGTEEPLFELENTAGEMSFVKVSALRFTVA
ncbi:unnamed protein product [Fusarium equiseti]|uniref:Uncharacterized protein n=1 Tax=Fusarium equiseti TaxID=61235 RepID=A0A8J2NMR5_FUSEQ|nr:unnamed protein product [Fusarium equiseti]